LIRSLRAKPGDAAACLGAGFLLHSKKGYVWVGVYAFNGSWYVGYSTDLTTISDILATPIAGTVLAGIDIADKVYLELTIARGRNTTNINVWEPKVSLRVLINGVEIGGTDDPLSLLDPSTFSAPFEYIGTSRPPLIAFCNYNVNAVTSELQLREYVTANTPLLEGVL
jgi:hypothetical protein